MYASVFNYQYEGVAYEVFSSPKFWFCLLLVAVILLAPIFAYRFYYLTVHPTLSDRVRLKQRMTKTKGKDIHFRRASTLRRSTRSLRSGYAFAHQEGFGELITSGLNMRQRAEEKNEPKNPVQLTKVKKFDVSPRPETVPTPHESILYGENHPHDPDHNKHVIFSERL